MVGVGVGVAVGDGVDVGVGVAVGDGVDVGEGVAVGDGVAVGVGFGRVTPLFQTSFLPLFIQVYFLPPAIAVDPTFLQTAPDLTAVWPGGEDKSETRNAPITMRITKFFPITICESKRSERLF
jgi:hypothetical protein